MTSFSTREEKAAWKREVLERAEDRREGQAREIIARQADPQERLMLLWLKRLWDEAVWLATYGQTPTGLPRDAHSPWRLLLWDTIRIVLGDAHHANTGHDVWGSPEDHARGPAGIYGDPAGPQDD